MFKNKKKLILYFSFILFIISFLWNAFNQRTYMITLYKDGIDKISSGNYQEAQESLGKLGDYKDSLEQIEIAKILEQKKEICDNAIESFNTENYEDSIKLFKQIEDFKDSKEYTDYYINFEELFEQIDGFKDSKEYIEKANALLNEKNNNESIYKQAYDNYESNNYILAIQEFSKINDYKDSEDMLQKCRLELARLQQATTISAGIRSSVGMIRHGKVYLAGDDEYSWESELETWNDIVSISVKGNFVVGLKEDGTVVMAGKVPEYYVGTKTWTDVIAISTGQQYIVGLRSDGTLVAQGHNGDHQVDIDGDEWTNIVAISAGWRHTVGLDSNGEIHITGLGSDSQLKQINEHKDDWNDIIAISAGGGSGDTGTKAFTVGLKKDKTVVTTLTGKIADEVSSWTDIIAISAGDSHIVGLKSDGTVITTETGKSAEDISEWTNVVDISASYGFTLGLKENGKVVATGYGRQGQIDVNSWENVTNYKEEWKSIFKEDLRWNGNK